MNTKFQTGEMVRATQGAGKFFASGDVGRVIRHAADGTVKVDWAAGNNPKGHYGDGEWWAKESELVRLTEAPPAKLTLPIVVGKKYVRRDGKVITAKYAQECSYWAALVEGDNVTAHNTVYLATGLVFGESDQNPFDLVSDYIEPAKGHPHAALMAQFADDASKSETPWDQWQMLDTHGEWFDMTRPPEWHITSHYRRRPKTTPDPHAENAAEYAKDMAETDKAWERWECKVRQIKQWMDCYEHPTWLKTVLYRRKEQA